MPGEASLFESKTLLFSSLSWIEASGLADGGVESVELGRRNQAGGDEVRREIPTWSGGGRRVWAEAPGISEHKALMQSELGSSSIFCDLLFIIDEDKILMTKSFFLIYIYIYIY